MGNTKRKKRRKKKSEYAAVPWRTLVVIAAGVLCCVAYVWQRNEIVNLGASIGEMRQQIKQFENENAVLTARRARLESPDDIKKRAKAMGMAQGVKMPVVIKTGS